MKVLMILIRRNIKLYFRDKGMFFTSLVTPAILLFLYIGFLNNVYRDSFTSSMPYGITLSDDILNGLTGGQLLSSLLSVTCVTVAFCTNFVMVQDRATGVFRDFTVTPVKPYIMSLSYYISTLVSTLIVGATAMGLGLVYVRWAGWYMSGHDVLMLAADVVLLVMLGTALSSVVCHFLSTQGQISATGAIISAGYGFICGAFVPVSSLSEPIRNILMYLPGTYGTSLLRNHALAGVFAEMRSENIPDEVIDVIKKVTDCTVSFGGSRVSEAFMYVAVGGAGAVLLAVYVLLNIFGRKWKYR